MLFDLITDSKIWVLLVSAYGRWVLKILSKVGVFMGFVEFMICLAEFVLWVFLFFFCFCLCR